MRGLDDECELESVEESDNEREVESETEIDKER